MREVGVLVDEASVSVNQWCARLGVLLGPDSAVYGTYASLYDAAVNFGRLIQELPPGLTTDQLRQRRGDPEIRAIVNSVAEAGDRVHDATAAFLAAASAALHESL
jgi:hypothetical protein